MRYSARRRRAWRDEQDYIVAKRRKKRRFANQMLLTQSGVPVPGSNEVIINNPAYTNVPNTGITMPAWLGSYIGEIAQTISGTWRWTGADWFQVIYGGGG